MNPAFIADGMLGSLARKLRLYGFDVVYFADLPDAALVERSLQEGRILLTSDRELVERATRKKAPCVLVTEKGDVSMAAEVFRALNVSPSMEVSSSRCPLCDGELHPAPKEGLAGQVPSGVLRRQKKFYQCVSCHHVYWVGSHWLRLSRFDEQVKEALKV